MTSCWVRQFPPSDEDLSRAGTARVGPGPGLAGICIRLPCCGRLPTGTPPARARRTDPCRTPPVPVRGKVLSSAQVCGWPCWAMWPRRPRPFRRCMSRLNAIGRRHRLEHAAALSAGAGRAARHAGIPAGSATIPTGSAGCTRHRRRCRPKIDEGDATDDEVSGTSMREHWDSGYPDEDEAVGEAVSVDRQRQVDGAGGDRLADIGPAADPGLEHTQGLELAYRLADAGATDAERRHQRALGGKAVAGAKAGLVDEAGQRIRHLPGAADGGERCDAGIGRWGHVIPSRLIRRQTNSQSKRRFPPRRCGRRCCCASAPVGSCCCLERGRKLGERRRQSEGICSIPPSSPPGPWRRNSLPLPLTREPLVSKTPRANRKPK